MERSGTPIGRPPSSLFQKGFGDRWSQRPSPGGRSWAGARHGISVAQIYRAANNPLLMDRMIARFRGDRGEFIPKGAVAARRAIAALRRGTH